MVGRGRSKRPSRTGLARVGGDVRLSVGWLRHRRCRQAGSGIARSRARARLNWVFQAYTLAPSTSDIFAGQLDGHLSWPSTADQSGAAEP